MVQCSSQHGFLPVTKLKPFVIRFPVLLSFPLSLSFLASDHPCSLRMIIILEQTAASAIMYPAVALLRNCHLNAGYRTPRVKADNARAARLRILRYKRTASIIWMGNRHSPGWRIKCSLYQKLLVSAGAYAASVAIGTPRNHTRCQTAQVAPPAATASWRFIVNQQR
jgi:hypothetical protein